MARIGSGIGKRIGSRAGIKMLSGGTALFVCFLLDGVEQEKVCKSQTRCEAGTESFRS